MCIGNDGISIYLCPMIGIYKITNIINNKCYIGSSKNVYKRHRRHFSELKNSKHKNKHLQAAYNKYGEANFRFDILQECLESELIRGEQSYIDSLNPEYNICILANSSLGVKRDDITKEKIRQANLGLKHPKWRNEIKSKAQGGENHWTKQKEFTEEAKINMSNAHKKLRDNGYVTPISKSVIELDSNNNIINEWSSLRKVGLYYGVDGMTIASIIKGQKSRKLPNKVFKYK